MTAPTETERALYEMARAASEAAYVPYCDFPVGAAVEFDHTTVVTGVNVDNASSPLTLCAERGAVSAGIAQGLKTITAVAVYGSADSVSPCGGCRQVLAEFAAPDCQVTFPWQGDLQTAPLSDLLPFSFRFERSTP